MLSVSETLGSASTEVYPSVNSSALLRWIYLMVLVRSCGCGFSAGAFRHLSGAFPTLQLIPS